MRHLEVKLLWLQEAVQKGRLVVGKVRGTVNVADALTKYHSAGKLAALSQSHGVVGAARTINAVESAPMYPLGVERFIVRPRGVPTEV